MEFKVVIPARLGSTRLPRKVLRQIAGKPLVQYVWEAARSSGAGQVVIATDDLEVADAVHSYVEGFSGTLPAGVHQPQQVLLLSAGVRRQHAQQRVHEPWGNTITHNK